MGGVPFAHKQSKDVSDDRTLYWREGGNFVDDRICSCFYRIPDQRINGAAAVLCVSIRGRIDVWLGMVTAENALFVIQLGKKATYNSVCVYRSTGYA